MTAKTSKVVGIDLGTTFSAIAHVNEFGKPEIIPNSESERITPSVILFDSSEAVTAGTIAKQNASAEPDKIVEFVKREMGKGLDDYSIEFFGKQYSAEALSAIIMKKLKTDAEERLGITIEDAVITVPAYFDARQRKATENAGKIAGFNVLQVLNEPTTAALAFGIHELGKDQNVFVFDLGGGTFDVTVMRIEGENIKMVATAGDHQLGGKDWDDAIIKYVASIFEENHGKNPLEDSYAYQDIQSKAIQAKHNLTKKADTKVVCSYEGNFENILMTRGKFEELTRNFVERCKSLTEQVLESDAKMSWGDIDTILLVGGSTRMPMIREMLQSLSGKPLSEEVNPDEAVALGACIQATLLEGKRKGEEPVITDNTGKNVGSMTAVNITSHTLGATAFVKDTDKLEVFPIIPRFTEVPCKITDGTFVTRHDNQDSLQTGVMEGESSIPGECNELGEVVVTDLPSGLPAGTKVAITFEFDESSILDASVEIAGRKGTAEIRVDGGLTKEQVEAGKQHIEKLKVE